MSSKENKTKFTLILHLKGKKWNEIRSTTKFITTIGRNEIVADKISTSNVILSYYPSIFHLAKGAFWRAKPTKQISSRNYFNYPRRRNTTSRSNFSSPATFYTSQRDALPCLPSCYTAYENTSLDFIFLTNCSLTLTFESLSKT